MKRMLVCLLIISSIIVSSFYLLNKLDNYNKTLTIMIDEAISLRENEKTEETLQKVEEITRFWKQYFNHMSIMIQTSKMNDISTSVAKLLPLLSHDNEEFFSECENIKFAITLVYDCEFPSFHSII